MAAASIRDSGLPPSLCPKCGERPRFRSGKTLQPYCKECYTADRRDRYIQKHRSTLCPKCGAKRTQGDCIHCAEIRHARLGEQRLREQFPGFVEAIAAKFTEAERRRLAANFYKNAHARFPRPSDVFPGLDPAFDARLIREHHDKDAPLCQAVASVPAGDQREFLDLYLVDPLDAQRWAMLPTWKRPMRKGDKDDQQIWAFFTMQRLNMELAARGKPWSLASQGAQLPQMFGAVARLTPAGVQRLVIVMNAYGVGLQYGRDLGDVTKKPWDPS